MLVTGGWASAASALCALKPVDTECKIVEIICSRSVADSDLHYHCKVAWVIWDDREEKDSRQLSSERDVYLACCTTTCA
jgi:hypothetical protein